MRSVAGPFLPFAKPGDGAIGADDDPAQPGPAAALAPEREGGIAPAGSTARAGFPSYRDGVCDSTSLTLAASCLRPKGLGRKCSSSAFSSLRRNASSA